MKLTSRLLSLHLSVTTDAWELLAKRSEAFGTLLILSNPTPKHARTKTTFPEKKKSPNAPNQTPSTTRSARNTLERVELRREQISITMLRDFNHLRQNIMRFFSYCVGQYSKHIHYFGVKWSVGLIGGIGEPCAFF